MEIVHTAVTIQVHAMKDKKVKLSACLTKNCAMKIYCGSGGIDPQ